MAGGGPPKRKKSRIQFFFPFFTRGKVIRLPLPIVLLAGVGLVSVVEVLLPAFLGEEDGSIQGRVAEENKGSLSTTPTLGTFWHLSLY